MAWFLVCAMGVAFGFVFRVPAVLAMGVVLFAVATLTGWLQGAAWMHAAASGFMFLALFEAAYVVGLLVSFAVSRTATRL